MASEDGLLETETINNMAKDFIDQPAASKASSIADACRVEKNRFRFVNHDALIPSLVAFLRSENEADRAEGIIASLRAIGNLTYEIERTRKQVYEAQATGTIAALLNSENGTVRKVAAGVVTNLVSESDDVQKSVLAGGAVRSLVSLLEDDEACFLALRGLGNLVCVESEKEVFLQEKLVAKFLAFAKEPEDNEDMIAEIFDIFIHLTGVPEFWAQMNEGSVVDVALAVLMRTELDKAAREKVSDFLTTVSKSDTLRSTLAPFFDVWMKLNRMDEPIQHGTGMMVLAHLSLDESNIKRFLSELDNVRFDPTSTDVKVQMGQAMLLGNLPHCDEDAIKIARDPRVFPLLVGYLKDKEIDERVTHLVVAGLRNLSLPVPNRPLFQEHQVLEDIIRIGKASKNAPIKFECVRCAKVLLLDDRFEDEFFQFGGMEFLSVVDESCVEDQAVRVALEAGRIWSRLASKPSRVPELLKKEGYVSPLLKLLESQFPVLQCEGAKGVEGIFENGKMAPTNVSMKLVRRLSELLLATDSVPVRTHCAKALSAVAAVSVESLKEDKGEEDKGEEDKGEEDKGVEGKGEEQDDEEKKEEKKEAGKVNVADLVGALGTLVFDQEEKEAVESLRRLLS